MNSRERFVRGWEEGFKTGPARGHDMLLN